MTVPVAEKYIAEGQFAPGSMLPKVEAAVAFAKSSPGRQTLITQLEKALDGMRGSDRDHHRLMGPIEKGGWTPPFFLDKTVLYYLLKGGVFCGSWQKSDSRRRL